MNAYAKTPLGQRIYDFGMSTVSDRWLARKYNLPIAEARRIRDRIRRAVSPQRKRQKRT